MMMMIYSVDDVLIENEVVKHTQFAEALSTGRTVGFRRTKVVFLGQERAGKTSTIKSMLHGTFDQEEASTKVSNQKGLELSLKIARDWKEYNAEDGRHLF